MSTKRLETKNYTIELDDDIGYGWFEHNELGDERGGGLWFERMTLLDCLLQFRNPFKAPWVLIDYDGVYYLPKQVGKALIDNGYLLGDCYE